MVEGFPSANSILYVGFNTDSSCFVVSTDTGFRVFNSQPVTFRFQRDFPGGIGIIEHLDRTNLLALVGGGRWPRFQPNKVVFWDDHQMRMTGELCFRSDVRAVKLRRDVVVVVLEHKVYVYTLDELRLKDTIQTADNPRGLCSLSLHPNKLVMACPDKQKGQVLVNLYDEERTVTIPAHESGIACLELSTDGKLLATASDKGTLIRIFNTEDGSMIQELRRGIDRAEIYSLSFSKNARWLASSSDKGTIHIFSVKLDQRPNPRSTLRFMKKLLPKYFDSEWSFAQLRIPDAKSICSFGKDNTIIVLNVEGMYISASFDPVNGGDCQRLEMLNVLDLSNVSS